LLENREQIAEGVALLEKALNSQQKSRRFGSYTLQTRCEWRAVQTMTNNFLRLPTQRSPEGFVKLLRAPGDWTPLVMEQP
jgi:hypothetical protein